MYRQIMYPYSLWVIKYLSCFNSLQVHTPPANVFDVRAAYNSGLSPEDAVKEAFVAIGWENAKNNFDQCISS